MREIKFRAWDVENKRLFFPRTMEFTPGGGWWITSENVYKSSDASNHLNFKKLKEFFEPLNGSNDENCILMQFTGLKDKNGVEIYEGDIVRISRYIVMDKKAVEVSYDCKCVYEERLARFQLIEIAHGGYYSHTEYELEVIGNTYQNPELLK